MKHWPVPLLRFGAVLGLFPKDLAAAIGPWLPRLDLAFGPLVRPRADDEGPPDGFSGLSRRGLPERLTMAEWLYALEEPLEFERRLVMGEALHLDLQRLAAAGARRTVILLDAGPSQWGAPRLVQLASLLVLSTRAEEAKIELEIGVLQARSDRTIKKLDPKNILDWLRRPLLRNPDRTDWERWAEALGLAPKQADDVWLLGGPPVRALGPPELSRAVVEDVLQPGERKVHIAVQRARHRESSLELPLPPADAAVRLLRDPFSIPKGPSYRRSGAPAGLRIHLSPMARRLFVRTRAGVMATFIEAGPKGAEWRIYSGREQHLMALGEHRKDVLLLTSDGTHLSLLTYRRGTQDLHVERSLPLDPAMGLWHPGVDSPLGDLWVAGADLYTSDQGGNLIRLRRGNALQVEVVLSGVVAWTMAAEEIYAAVDAADPSRGEQAQIMRVSGSGPPVPTWSLRHRSPLECFMAKERREVSFATRVAAGEWMIEDRRQGLRTFVDPAATVLGLEARRAALVAMTPARRALLFLRGPNQLGRIYPDGTIQDAVVKKDRVAVLLEGGGLRVFSTVERKELLHIDPGEDSP